MSVQFKPCTRERLRYFLNQLEAETRLEYLSQTELGGIDLLLTRQEAWIGHAQGEPVMAFGVIEYPGHFACWAGGTPAVQKYPRLLARWSATWMRLIRSKYRGKPITCLVQEGFDRAHRWVRWLGFVPTAHRWKIGGHWQQQYELRIY